MSRRVFVSILIILLSMAAIGGGTLAWFTASTDPVENVFTAGTVAIQADEEIITGEDKMENWNPGDCAEKEFTIVNTGTKGIALRGLITTQWYEKVNGEWVEWTPTGDDAVKVTIAEGDTDWSQGEDGNWYYAETIPGTYTEQDEAKRTVTLTLKVCLDGPKAGNQYQGKQFRLSAQFQAIQASHADEWDWDDFDDYN